MAYLPHWFQVEMLGTEISVDGATCLRRGNDHGKFGRNEKASP